MSRGTEHNRLNTDAFGTGLSSLSTQRKLELMNMQMNVVSAWMEPDSLGDSTADVDKWLSDDMDEWISSRLQDASAGQNTDVSVASAASQLALAESSALLHADNSTNLTDDPAPEAYHEFEKGATAQLGNGVIWWSMGMKEFLLNLNSSQPNSTGPLHHLAIRRKIGARMLLEETDETNGWIEEEISDYAPLYMTELRSRTSVVLSDITKSGGADLCFCGFEAGCKALNDNAQCDTASALDRVATREILPGSHTLPERCLVAEKWQKEHGATLVDYEDHLKDFGLCHNFWNVIVLRDPLDRIVSHLNYLNMSSNSDAYRANLVTPNVLFEEIPLLTNNLFIRKLIGPKGYELPFGQITPEHLAEAKRVLDSFDLVLMKTSSLKEDLYSFMGWDCDHHASQTGKPEEYFKILAKTWTPEQWQALIDANYLDRQLVQYARMLERVDKKVFHHPFFTFFLHQMQFETCDAGNTHCGYLCK